MIKFWQVDFFKFPLSIFRGDKSYLEKQLDKGVVFLGLSIGPWLAWNSQRSACFSLLGTEWGGLYRLVQLSLGGFNGSLNCTHHPFQPHLSILRKASCQTWWLMKVHGYPEQDPAAEEGKRRRGRGRKRKRRRKRRRGSLGRHLWWAYKFLLVYPECSLVLLITGLPADYIWGVL